MIEIERFYYSPPHLIVFSSGLVTLVEASMYSMLSKKNISSARSSRICGVWGRVDVRNLTGHNGSAFAAVPGPAFTWFLFLLGKQEYVALCILISYQDRIFCGRETK